MLIVLHYTPSYQNQYYEYKKNNLNIELYVGNTLGITEDGVKAQLSDAVNSLPFVSLENHTKFARMPQEQKAELIRMFR